MLALFGIAPKTHDPAREIAAILRTHPVPETIQQKLKEMLPDLLALGAAEHFLTDYGDEASYTLPWDLFTEESALEALATARRSIHAANICIEAIIAWQKEQSTRD